MVRAVSSISVRCRSAGAAVFAGRGVEPGGRKQLASGALRRGLREKGVREQLRQHRLVGAPLLRQLAVPVHRGAEVACRVQVEQHVAGPAIEPERRLGLARQKRDVADAADVDDCTRRIRSEYGGMKGGDEWGTLAARGKVAAPEVGDDIDAGGFRQMRRRVQLNREADVGPVPHRLTMRADGTDLGGREAGGAECRSHAFGIGRRELQRGGAGTVDLVGAGCAQMQQFGPQVRIERPIDMREDLRQCR